MAMAVNKKEDHRLSLRSTHSEVSVASTVTVGSTREETKKGEEKRGRFQVSSSVEPSPQLSLRDLPAAVMGSRPQSIASPSELTAPPRQADFVDQISSLIKQNEQQRLVLHEVLSALKSGALRPTGSASDRRADNDADVLRKHIEELRKEVERLKADRR